MTASSVSIVIALLLAVLVAVRSTWSPCGQSMLSTLTPLTERGRGHRWGVTVGWFVAGAVLGGLTLGAAMAVLAWIASLVSVPATAALGTVAVVALVTSSSDAGLLGRGLPFHTRQVAESWLDNYRQWVYASGFGWQIGVGVATYVMTAALYLFVVAVVVTASPLVAIVAGALFGLVRGLAILLGINATTTDRLLALHVWFESARAPVRRATVLAQCVIAATAGLVAWATDAPIATLVIVVAATAIAVVGLASRNPTAEDASSSAIRGQSVGSGRDLRTATVDARVPTDRMG
jgi:hypothetical protein